MTGIVNLRQSFTETTKRYSSFFETFPCIFKCYIAAVEVVLKKKKKKVVND